MESNMFMPGHPRYQPKDLQHVFGYDRIVYYYTLVEYATLYVMRKLKFLPKDVSKSLSINVANRWAQVTTTEVDKIERKVTKHDIRALVMLLQEKSPKKLRPWIHVGLTSYDVVDTARALQMKDAHKVLQRKIREVIVQLKNLAKDNRGTLQIGRTHGQHALPITAGFWVAGILCRLVKVAHDLDKAESELVGKISGAVGAYNAQEGIGLSKLCGSESFEDRVLKNLGLKPSVISTQIVPPEPMINYLFQCFLMTGVLAQFAEDCRHLMRSEIAEIGEPFAKGQVGSSTMAHKRNPINFENICGMHENTMVEFQRVMVALVSEHQRDLTDSSLMRYWGAVPLNLCQQLDTLLREDTKGRSFLSRITLNKETLKKNFDQSSHLVLAEPLYIVLQMYGFTRDAHKFVNHGLVPIAIDRNKSLVKLLKAIVWHNEHTLLSDEFNEDFGLLPELRAVLQRIPEAQLDALEHPEQYIGLAHKKVDEAVEYARTYYAPE